jgi:hypothetical protein
MKNDSHLTLTENNAPKIVALLHRLKQMLIEAQRHDPNRSSKFDPASAEAKIFEMSWIETFLLYRIFRVKSQDQFSRNLSQSRKVIGEAGAGIHSWRTVAAKVQTLHDRISRFYPELATKAEDKTVIVDHSGPDRESDADRLTRLAIAAERSDLLVECERIQPECWKLACELDLREKCTMLPRGFKALDLEEIKKLKGELERNRAEFKTEAETRARLVAEVEAELKATEEKERKELEEIQRLYDACRKELKNLLDFAALKRVRLDYIELPHPTKASKEELECALKKLKSFRPRIEARALELDPKRNRVRTSNPAPLRSPLAA